MDQNDKMTHNIPQPLWAKICSSCSAEISFCANDYQRPQDVLQLKVEEEKPVDDEEPDPDEPFNFKIWSGPPPEPWICC